MNLELVPTEDLLQEVVSRFDAYVFAGVISMNGNDSENMGVVKNHGELFRCLGLATHLQYELEQGLREHSREPEDWER